jgi:hypothetical protein
MGSTNTYYNLTITDENNNIYPTLFSVDNVTGFLTSFYDLTPIVAVPVLSTSNLFSADYYYNNLASPLWQGFDGFGINITGLSGIESNSNINIWGTAGLDNTGALLYNNASVSLNATFSISINIDPGVASAYPPTVTIDANYIQNLSPVQISSLTGSRITQLTTAQVDAFTLSELYIMNYNQVSGFTSQQLNSMTSDQLLIINNTLSQPGLTLWYNMNLTPLSPNTVILMVYFSLDNDSSIITAIYNYQVPSYNIVYTKDINTNGASYAFVYTIYPIVSISNNIIIATGGFRNIAGGGITVNASGMPQIASDIESNTSSTLSHITALNLYGGLGPYIAGIYYQYYDTDPNNPYWVYYNDVDYNVDYEQIPNNPFLPCFNKDSKILILNSTTKEEEYVLIQNIRKGTLVKTFGNGYVPVDMIGQSSLLNPNTKERIKTRLYKLSKSNYSELFEDLILTGCHSILVDGFKNEEEKQKVIDVNGDIYVTDNKYRLPACADEKSEPFDKEGEFTIYHIALENENYYSNYGIYANGLLVESCSKRYLKELSKMTLLE